MLHYLRRGSSYTDAVSVSRVKVVTERYDRVSGEQATNQRELST